MKGVVQVLRKNLLRDMWFSFYRGFESDSVIRWSAVVAADIAILVDTGRYITFFRIVLQINRFFLLSPFHLIAKPGFEPQR